MYVPEHGEVLYDVLPHHVTGRGPLTYPPSAGLVRRASAN